LNPSGEIVQFGALGRFTESANTKAGNFMRAGVGSTEPVSHNEGFDRYLGNCRGILVAFLAKGPLSPGVFIMDLPGAFVVRLNGIRVGNRIASGGGGDRALTSQMASTWPIRVGEVLGVSWSWISRPWDGGFLSFIG